MSIINDLVVKDKTTYEGVKIRAIYYRDLIENKDNKQYKQNEIEAFARNIEEIGLLNPIVVTDLHNGYFLIISGHRRYNAIKLLIEEGNEKFEDIPCRVMNLDEDEKRVALFGSNAQRQYEIPEKIEISKALSDLYDELVAQKKRPPGRKTEWIAAMTGFGARSIQDYLTGKHKALSVEAEENGKSSELKPKTEKPIDMVKALASIEKKLIDIEDKAVYQDIDTSALNDLFHAVSKAIQFYKDLELQERE